MAKRAQISPEEQARIDEDMRFLLERIEDLKVRGEARARYEAELAARPVHRFRLFGYEVAIRRARS